MDKFTYITSSKNDEIKKLVKLKNKNKREKYNLFIIEGYRELASAIDSNVEIKTLFICQDLFLKSNEIKLIDKCSKKNVKILECSKDLFEKISYRDRPDGLIAVARPFDTSLKGLQKLLSHIKNPFLVVCEGIEKPGNLGTILRTADASGASAVIASDPQTDVFNPNVVRASIGTLFTVPVFTGKSKEVIELLKKNNIAIVSSSPSSEVMYMNCDLKKPIALVLGTEQLGLSDIWFKNASDIIKIPMLGKADSLNVSAAATILLYETLRQRS